MSEKIKDGGLVDGKIPPHTPCPFRDKCGAGICYHKGTEHTVAFSCAFARGFAMLRAREGE